MKKSKIIVPALGILLLSTAASISGTVAWFTANRTFNFTAGEFAVVNTKNNLNAVLASGIGTTADNEDHKVDVNASYTLTDASFDHTSLTEDIIIPNDEGLEVLRVVNLGSAIIGTTNTGNAMFRETNVYSAFTWDATFSLTFSTSETQKVGLFLDLSDADTYVHEKVVYGSTHTFTTADAGTYYTNAACTEGAVTKAAGDTIADGTYYQEVPNDTGKAFRIAIVPKTMADGCFGVTKVWAPNQTTGNCKFVDGKEPNDSLDPDVYAGTAYSTATTSKTGSAAIAAQAVGTDKVLMASGDASIVPADGAKSSTTALSDCTNYIGYFNPNPGNTVELTYTFVAWYEGTDPNTTNDKDTVYETVVASLQFGISKLSA